MTRYVASGRRVFERLRSLWREYGAATKDWRLPRRADVLIYDGDGEETLRAFFPDTSTEVLYLRGESLNVPVLLASVAGFLRGNRHAYVDRFVRAVRPRLVITLIDNRRSFYRLSGAHPGVRTMFLQNGMRARYGDVFEALAKPDSEVVGHVDDLLTFGEDVGIEFNRFLTGRVTAIGSLLNNEVPRGPKKLDDVLAFVSQYRESDGYVVNGRWLSHEEFFVTPDAFVLGQLARFATTRGKRLRVISCVDAVADPERGERERRYFERLIGGAFEFVPKGAPGTSYQATDSAAVTVTIDSTLGYEAAARGNRTAFICARLLPLGIEDLGFGWPSRYADDGPFWTNRRDPEAVERILDYLFEITDAEYRETLRRHGYDRVITFDPGNRLFRNLLQRALLPEAGGLSNQRNEVHAER